MPEVDGYETIKQIIELVGETMNKSLIIACTAQGDEETEKLSAAGFGDILSKPISRKSVITLLKKWGF